MYTSILKNLTDEIYYSRYVWQMILLGVFSVLQNSEGVDDSSKAQGASASDFVAAAVIHGDGHSHLDNIPLYFHLWLSYFM